MPENSDGAGKGSKERIAAARQLRNARAREREQFAYTVDRTGADYIQELGGVRHLFSYVKTLGNPKVLDIGAGTTRGVSELAQSALSEGLDFEATVLRNRLGVKENLGEEQTHITSAETLRGIPDLSVACVIAVYSTSYSDAPNLVIESIDRVLVPGGAVKMGGYEKIFNQFIHLLQARGYDVDDREKWGEFRVLLAIKPGGASTVTAAELIKADEESFEEQVKLLK